MIEKSQSSSGGIGLVSILTIIFVVCKLFGVIDWSWWWVFSPIWISWAILLVVLSVVGIGLLIAAFLGWLEP